MRSAAQAWWNVIQDESEGLLAKLPADELSVGDRSSDYFIGNCLRSWAFAEMMSSEGRFCQTYYYSCSGGNPLARLNEPEQ
jgi:hypothetical protein